MRRRKAAGSFIVALALVTSIVTTAPPAGASEPLPEFKTGLGSAATELAQISLLSELLPTIAGFGANPAMVLGLHEMLGDLAVLTTTVQDFDVAIEALSDPAGFQYTFGGVDTNGDVTTVTFDIAAAARSVSLPIIVMEDDVQIIGSDVTATVTMPATTVTLEYDGSVADPAQAFSLTSLPTFSLNAVLDTTVNIPIQFGFADATASGDVDLDFDVSASLVDPDGLDRLTLAELQTLAVEDFVALDLTAGGNPDLSLDLNLTADVYGTTFGGNLTISDTDLFADPAAAINLSTTGANPISLMSNFGPDLAITSLAQVISGFGLGMIAGDVELPFLGDGIFIPDDLGADDAGFDRVFEVIQPLIDYITPRSSGQIVCGTVAIDPDDGGPIDGIPAGSVRNLTSDDTAYCRAYTSVDGGGVDWTVTSGNGTITANDTETATIGADPTKNVVIDMTGTGDLKIEVAYTPDGETDPVTIVQRPDTIQQLLAELAEEGLIPLDGLDPAFTYDSNLEAFTFDLSTQVAAGISRAASVNAGNTFVADTGITGLSASSSASATVDLGAVNAAITLGLIVTEDVADIITPSDSGPAPNEPGPGDRFFVKTSGPILSVDEVDIGGTLVMDGRLGFLEINATASGSLSEPIPADPAVAVSLANPAGVQVGTGTNDPNAVLIRDLLQGDPTSTVAIATNLQFDGTVAVTSSAPGVSLGGGFDVVWNLDDASPAITFSDPDFQQQLLPFDTDLTLTQNGPADPDDETLLTTNSADLLTQPGLVGSQLVDAAGNVCTITAVISSTQLTCSTTGGGTDPNPIDFSDGTSYEVAGNTLAHLLEILEALDGLVAYLETMVGEDTFDAPLDIVGIRPADIVGQIDELKRMIKEFRGIQDAQITCSVQGDGDADIRAIPIPDPAPTNVTIECSANAPTDAANSVQWRITDGDGSGSYQSGADTTVGANGSLTTIALDVPVSLDANGDGFISIGSEYAVDVEWNDSGGDHQTAFPPRVPQSLQDLSNKVNEILELPDGLLTFDLVDPTGTPTLRIDLGYGICSDTAPTSDGTDPCAGLPTGPTPNANLNLDLGAGLPDFVGVDTSGALDVRYAALGQFDLGIPLDGTAPVLYGTTGLDARIEVVGTGLGFSASIGPAKAVLGADATGATGTADEDTAADVLSDGEADPAFTSTLEGAVVTNTTDGVECIVTATTATTLTCDAAEDWDEDDGYAIGGAGVLHAALQFNVDLTDASDVVLPDGDSVAIGDAGVDITDLDTFLAGDASCGPIDESLMDEIFGASTGSGDGALDGITCARLSLALMIGDNPVYLGELGLELDGGGLGLWVPADLATRLEDAFLNPAFLLQVLPDILSYLEDGMRDAAGSGIPSAVADPLRTGADGLGAVGDAVESGTAAFEAALDLTNMGSLESSIETALEDLLGSDLLQSVDATAFCDTSVDPAVECDPGDTIDQLEDIQVLVTFGQTEEAATGVNLGLEGLPLSVETGVGGFAEWSITFGVGVSLDDGPYIALRDPADGPELAVTAGANLSDGPAPSSCVGPIADSVDPADYTTDRCIKARLAFLFVTALDSVDDPSTIGATLGLDVTSGGGDRITLKDLASGDLGLDPVLEGGVHVDLHIRTGIGDGSPDMPSLLGTFVLDWELSAADTEIAAPDISFGDLHLDLGSFLSDFINPITREIKKITGPLQPVIDVITAEIPVVSDLAKLVGGDPITMISVLEAATGADLSLIEAVAAFINFINGLPTDSDLQIPLGGIIGGTDRDPGAFTVNAAQAANPVSQDQAGSLIDQNPATYEGGNGFTSDVSSKASLSSQTSVEGRPATFGVPGLTFPFLEDASQLFGILVGRDATLIRWDAGTMKASAGISYDFGPILVGPVPITITLGGEIGIEGRFAIGYDTSGIRKLLDGGSGVALFDGIFIDDLDTQGNDVAEVKFYGRVFAGASVDLVIVSAGVRGGVELTFALDLDDRPDPDGKLRIEEIVDKLANPICLFVVSGKIEAFLEVFVEIDLFLFSKEFSFELVRITLLEWSSACEPPAPELSKIIPNGDGDNVLYLNIGDRADLRNIQEDIDDEAIEVRQIGIKKVRVTGFGWEETRENVDLIVADGGSGDDEILFLPGAEEGVDPTDGAKTELPFDIPVVVSGGAGNDIIKTGDAADRIFGDAAIAASTWQSIDYNALTDEGGSAGNDAVNAGDGDDVVLGNGGDDTMDGEFGMDTIEGGADNDTLNGGPGNDAVLGNGGSDQIQGGPVDQPDEGGTPAPDDDALSGGSGSDTVTGDLGNDIVFGDDPAGGFFTTSGEGVKTWSTPSPETWRGWCDVGSGDPDLLTGNDGDDFIIGGGGDDAIDAGAGDDYACGSGGDDEIIGDVGDDELRGNDDDDTIEGNEGHDVIYGGDDNDIANGNEDDDDIFGDAGADLLYGDDGDDIVVGDTGTVTGGHAHGVDGAGIDQAAVVAINAAVTRNSSTSNPRRADCEFASGIGDSDCVFGGTGSDALFGGSDGDILRGESGSDLIEGNHGDDEMRGGTEQDLLFGNADDDTMYGDGGPDLMYGDRSIPDWVTDDPAGAGVDTMYGGPGADDMEGDGADDDMFGGADPDHMEGNGGNDTMFGESGDDDMIGGSDNDGAEPDTGETLMSGGLGSDVMAGDNATITPTLDGYVGGRTVELLSATVGGGDTMEGDAATDYMFGQVGDDTMWGDQGTAAPLLGLDDADYMEGNDGDDTMRGEGGGDDMIGGSSADDGVIDVDRAGTDATDSGETEMSGGAGDDWMAGDNARMDRVIAGLSLGDPTALVLFDLAGTGKDAVPAAAHGGDTMNGDAGTDFMFGQGSDDTMSGGDLPDYMEGNDGNDDMSGNGGDDDMIGGGSAYDGIIDQIRVGEQLWDEGETLMSGGDGVDWMAGDNAFMNRVLFDDTTMPIDLFDVNSSDADVSGGDTMEGNAGEDLMFGQGNGGQDGQADPPDGVDNDGNGLVDEDAAWLGDVMYGNADDDYIEGNHGSDLIYGNDGEDDLIGGGSALDGRYVPERVGDLLEDERDTIYGGGGVDVITGDNARINRGGDVQTEITGLVLPSSTDREVLLFDVDSATAALSGGDFLSGGGDRDLMFGQGNGGQDDQADPLDGVDNDFDGREDATSTEYDCADGYDNDGDGLVDGDEPGCSVAVDEDQPWDGDYMLGNAGDDYMEGNHGADWMFGNEDEDDMIGGGSANDGAIVPNRDPEGLNDGPDVMQGSDEDDVMTGDNARINRVLDGAAWQRLSTSDLTSPAAAGFGPYDQAVRVTDMFAGDAGANAHGDDYMDGDAGNDEMYGQLGDDFVLGDVGDDAMVGDLGQVRANLIGDAATDPDPETIATQSPRWEATIYENGSLWWETQLYAYDTSDGGVGGDDILLGHDGRDTAFGGPGDDLINGDGDGTDEVFDAENPEFTHITDIDAATVDEDFLFGGDNDDAVWGGRDNDILMGGHGNDFLDVRPREATDNGRSGANFRIIPRDPPSWFTWAFPENFQDVDFIYGGWDQDALQADQAENGPDPGDRLADWAGGYNVFYLCPAGYGDFTITRSGSPFVRRFIQDLAEASGAYDAAADGTSGFRDVGFVFPNQRGQNSHPPHPDHPGHFTCADYTGVGSGLADAQAGGPYAVPEGGEVTLDANASSGFGRLRIGWNAGPFDIDDAASATAQLSAAGVDDGTVDIELEVEDEDGAWSFDVTQVEVTNVAPSITGGSVSATVIDGDVASLEATFADPGTLDTHGAVIDWGDGTTCDSAADAECALTGTAGSGTVTGTHAYAGLGTYEVAITVTDDDGDAISAVLGSVDVIESPPPQVATSETWIAADPWPIDPVTIAGDDYGRAAAVVVMAASGRSERSSTLFAEVVAAVLNVATGTDGACIETTLSDADAWLTANPPGSGVKENSDAWSNGGSALSQSLRDYNAGLLCAP